MTDHADIADAQWNDIYYSSQDGLKLYARHYPAPRSSARPVLCLPGLTRNSKDFHVLASRLSQSDRRPRNVYCLDFRGRGNSDRDPDWGNYTPYMELLDTLNFITIAGLHEAAVVGTSRGGIVTMLMAVMRPTAIGSCVLNDIGPVIETTGLARIVGYVGKVPTPASWAEAGGLARRMNESFFPGIPEHEWEQIARQWFIETDGRLSTDYDPKLADTMESVDLTKKMPDMWPQFKALSNVPTLAIRGENSDILSDKTLREMSLAHPALTAHRVRDQGHAPLLRDQPTIETIQTFLSGSDPRH